MSLEQLTLSDEQVQDIVASLITSGNNADTVYDDVNDTLTVSLTDSISVNTLEATQSITDPEGNTVTSLSDPVRVTEEASTFAEPNVTITQTNTEKVNGSIALKSPEIIDDVEDGDTTTKSTNWDGWNSFNASVTAQQNTVISGSHTLECSVSNANGNVSAQNSNGTTKDLDVTIQIGSDTGNSGDKIGIDIQGPSGTNSIGLLSFNDGGGDVDFNGSRVLTSWSANTNYSVSFNFDFATDEVNITINGSDKGTFAFTDSSTNWGLLVINNDTSSSGNTRSVFIDDVIAGKNATFGDVLTKFDSGAPADIDSYDLATFQRTLDGETVTIDVEDSSGTVLKSDISKDTDISDIATSTDVQLRANLSRNDTANNPTVDYLARRFVR